MLIDTKKIKLGIKLLCSLLLILQITGCPKRDRRVKLPPVAEGWRQSTAKKNAYIVHKKDTLYSIAWAFGIDYRALARGNNIDPPYNLKVGQRLYIVSSAGNITASQTPAKKAVSSVAKSKPKGKSVMAGAAIPALKGWSWPAKGKVVKGFNNKPGGNKGIDISGKYGDAVFAGNAGKVVYKGAGIRSYGNLVIIKHSTDYLSAYAYNSKIFVNEGDTVRSGEKIASMGRNDSGKVCVHFEIRKLGKPVNPLSYLSKKP